MTKIIEQSIAALEVQNISHLQTEVTILLESNQKNYYRIGTILNFLSDNLKKEKYNEWLKNTTNYSKSQLCKYMKISANYTEKEAIELGVKKAYLILKIQDENERNNFINSEDIKNKSFEETQKLLMEYLNGVTDNKETKKNNDTKILKSADKSIEKILKDISKLDATTNKELISKINELKSLINQVMNSSENDPDNKNTEPADTDNSNKNKYEDENINLRDLINSSENNPDNENTELLYANNRNDFDENDNPFISNTPINF